MPYSSNILQDQDYKYNGPVHMGSLQAVFLICSPKSTWSDHVWMVKICIKISSTLTTHLSLCTTIPHGCVNWLSSFSHIDDWVLFSSHPCEQKYVVLGSAPLASIMIKLQTKSENKQTNKKLILLIYVYFLHIMVTHISRDSHTRDQIRKVASEKFHSHN